MAERFGRAQHFGQARGAFGQRHEAAARALRQAFEQCLNLVLQHARHQPFAARFAHLIEHEQRHRHRQAVLGVARLVQVSGAAIDTAQANHLGEGAGGDAGRLVAHQLIAREQQQIGLRAAGVAPPRLEIAPVADAWRHLRVVKGVDQLVIDQHVLPAAFVLQLFDLGDGLGVGLQKRQAARPVFGPFAIDQCFADEDLARGAGIDVAKAPAAPAVDHQAVHRGALQRDHVLRFFLPVRLQQLLSQEMAADFFQPLGLDVRNAAAEQARGLHQFGRHDPAAGLFAEVRTGVAMELDAARAQVFAAWCIVVFKLVADVAQQAGEQGFVQRFVASGLGVFLPLVLGHHGVQLRVDVAPLAHAADADEVLAQQAFPLTIAEFVGGRGIRRLNRTQRHRGTEVHRGFLFFPLSLCASVFYWLLKRPPRRFHRHRRPLRCRQRGQIGRLLRCTPAFGCRHLPPRLHHLPAPRIAQPFPQPQIAAELALLVVKLGMRLIGLRLLLQWPVAHVLHAQGRRDDQHLAQCAPLARFQNHATHARVERQARQLGAQGGELLRVVHRAQLLQQLNAIGNRAARGHVEKRKVLHPPALSP